MVANNLSDTHVAMCEIRYRQGPSTDQVARSASRNGGTYYGGIEPNFKPIDNEEQSDLRKMTALRNSAGNQNSGAGNVKCREAVYFVHTGAGADAVRQLKRAEAGGKRRREGANGVAFALIQYLSALSYRQDYLKGAKRWSGCLEGKNACDPFHTEVFQNIRYAGTPPTHRSRLPPILAIP